MAGILNPERILNTRCLGEQFLTMMKTNCPIKFPVND